MNQIKIFKLIGISLIVIGILGFLVSCNLLNKTEDNNGALLLGAAVVQQQAAEAAYQQMLNTPNPTFFCAVIFKNTPTSYNASLQPLPSNDCTYDGLKAINNSVKDIVDNEFNDAACDATEEDKIKNLIDNMNNVYVASNSNLKLIFVADKSLKNEVNVSYDISSKEVVSPNTYKNVSKYTSLLSFAKSTCGSACGGFGTPQIDNACYNAIKTFVESKISDINQYCISIDSFGCLKYDLTNVSSPFPQTKILGGKCYYGSGASGNTCATLNDQF